MRTKKNNLNINTVVVLLAISYMFFSWGFEAGKVDKLNNGLTLVSVKVND